MAVVGWLKTYRWLGLGLVLLFFSIYQTLHVLRGAKFRGTPAPLTSVVVTRSAVAADTRLAASELTVKRYPPTLVPPGAFHAVTNLNGQWTLVALATGVPVVQRDVARIPTSNPLARHIPQGDVAMALAATPESAVDSLISPGDRVSLFVRIKTAPGESEVRELLGHVLVLAVNGRTQEGPPPGPGKALTLILPLSPNQAAALWFAEKQGDIAVTLDAPGSAPSVSAPYTQQTFQTAHP